MRAYNMTDGTRCVPFRIEFFLDREALIDALAYDLRNDDPDAELPTLSRAEVVKRVRDTLEAAGGMTYHYWADYAGHREEELRMWAEAAIDRTMGDLFEGGASAPTGAPVARPRARSGPGG